MADIEAVLYQVRVPGEHRSFLRFLWWKDNNTSNDIVDHEMNVHVFNGTSSPSCSIMHLDVLLLTLKISLVRRQQLLWKIIFILMACSNRSIQTVKDATSITHDVTAMCAVGRFNLTNFTRNIKEVLLSIPDERKRKCVKDQDLSTAEIPQERALRIIWQIEEDTLGFHLQLPKKPSTRRGLLNMLSSTYDPLGIAGLFLLEGRSIIQELCKNDLNWDEKVLQDFTME